MSNSEITHVSDTALLVAACRAAESERPDAFFHDPFARRLAGERGAAMCRSVPHPEMMMFGIAVRTRCIDELLLNAIANAGITTVLSLGSGLDTRPWRLELPSAIRWIEVDFPAMLDYKDSLLAGEKSRCRRERLSADLNNPAERRATYAAAAPGPVLLLTEGFLMYLPASTVRSLASETSREPSIQHWISDITTSAFTQAIGGGGLRSVSHVRAEDHLEGEQILAALSEHAWKTAARRSYITDLGFARDRITTMMRGQPEPPKRPNFAPDDPSGIHHFARAN